MSEMHEIVTCPDCKSKEYYGMMHMRNGRTYCRKCIYEIWAKETDYEWQPHGLHTFPIYDDGIDYTRGEIK